MLNTVKVCPSIHPLYLRPSSCLAIIDMSTYSSSKLISSSFHMTSLLCQTPLSWPAASEALPNLAQCTGRWRQYNKNKSEGDWLDVTAVVKYMSQEGMCHTDCRIALIYYTLKPYFKYAVVFRISLFFFLSPKAVPNIHYLYVLSVLQRISGGNTNQPKAPLRLAPWALQCFYGSYKENTQKIEW